MCIAVVLDEPQGDRTTVAPSRAGVGKILQRGMVYVK